MKSDAAFTRVLSVDDKFTMNECRMKAQSRFFGMSIEGWYRIRRVYFSRSRSSVDAFFTYTNAAILLGTSLKFNNISSTIICYISVY